MAFASLQKGRVADARQLSDGLLATHVENAEVLFLASEVRLAEDDPEGALGFIEAAVAAAPGQWPLLLKQAENLIMLRRRAQARQVAADAIAVAGNDGRALWEIGKVYSRCDDPAGALPLYERALAVMGRHPAFLYDLAVARHHTGDSAGAEAILDALLNRAPKFGHACYLRSTLRRQTDARNHVRELEQRLAAGFPTADARVACLFALAKEREDLGQDAASFSALAEGAALKRQNLTYDAAAERDAIDGIRKAYTQAVMQTEVAGHEQGGAIFIVGMHRSGTSLMERMLGANADVCAMGETERLAAAVRYGADRFSEQIPDVALLAEVGQINFDLIRQAFNTAAQKQTRGKRFVTEKTPGNFLNIGFIQRALPNAKIVHMRREPVDLCFANYRELLGKSLTHANALDDLIHYHHGYENLLQHWQQIYPGRILDVDYEQLVQYPEAQSQRVFEFCGLPWQPEMVDLTRRISEPVSTLSSVQVRQPVNTASIGRWRPYAQWLGDLTDQFGAN